MENQSEYFEFSEIDPNTKEPIRYEVFMGYLALMTISNYIFKYLAEIVVPRNGPEIIEKIKTLYNPSEPSSILALAGEEGVSLELNDADKNKIGMDSLLILKPFLIKWDVENGRCATNEQAEAKYNRLFINMSRKTGKDLVDFVQGQLDDFFLQEYKRTLNLQTK